MSDESAPIAAEDVSPQHGFQGEHAGARPAIPAAPSIAISREVGARGNDIARRIAAKNGWTVYDNELLGYSSLDPSAVDGLLAEMPPSASQWVEDRMHWLHASGVMANDAAFVRVARLILALGAKGEAIFVGRGAGFMLPRETTLHVRMTAPLENRIAYMSQWLRLPRDEAAKHVAAREEKRSEFLSRCFPVPAGGLIYDMVLNSNSLGEELCADLILQALKSKQPAGDSKFDV